MIGKGTSRRDRYWVERVPVSFAIGGIKCPHKAKRPPRASVRRGIRVREQARESKSKEEKERERERERNPREKAIR